MDPGSDMGRKDERHRSKTSVMFCCDAFRHRISDVLLYNKIISHHQNKPLVILAWSVFFSSCA